MFKRQRANQRIRAGSASSAAAKRRTNQAAVIESLETRLMLFGTATQLVFIQQPSDSYENRLVTPPVEVAIEDASGNIVTNNDSVVKGSVNSGPSSGTLTETAVDGVATFGGISFGTPGTYTLKAQDGSLSQAISHSFVVSSDVSTQLAFITAPTSATAGTLPVITVAVEDSSGHVLTGDTSTVHLAVYIGPSQAELGGTSRVIAINGVATFNAASLTVAGTYTLVATEVLLTQAISSSFVISPAAPSKLFFSSESINATAGAKLPAVKVLVEDTFGNLITNASTVTVALSTPSGSLSGTLAVKPVNGVATFANLSVAKVGTYTLKAKYGTLPSATSISFTISTAAASKLVFTKEPANSTAGKTLAPMTVSIEDKYGNVVLENTSVALSIATGPIGATLGGTLSVLAINGVATYSTLSLTKSGTYTLKATHGVLTAATSTSFKISTAAASKLVFTKEPVANPTSNKVSTVDVSVEDKYGNVVPNNTTTVAIAIATGPAGASLAGTLAEATINGVATFSTLTLSKAGTYTLKASHGVLTAATSTSFAVA